jgi:hypothetical protein
MTFPLPATDIETRVIIAGPGRIYIGAYQAAGADCPSSVFLGATDDGVEIHHAYTRHAIGVDQALNDVEVIPTKEQVTIKTKIVELTLSRLYKLFAQVGMGGGMTLTGGTITDPTSTLTVGEQLAKLYWQLGVKVPAPPGATTGSRIYQIWKAVLISAGAVKYQRAKESSMDLTWQALTDFTVVDPTNRIYTIHDS